MLTRRIASRRIVNSIVAVFVTLFGITSANAATNAPNILLITVDNLGYGDLSIYNPDSLVKTPRLEKLASQGIRLTDFYTASPTCTVSRACLLTGRVPQRHGLRQQLPGLKGNYGVGLNPQETLIPQMLQKAGYATGCFGKWNIGFAAGSRPTERGFDEFLGHASGNMDYYHHVYNGRHDLYRGIAPFDAEGKYATDLFADEAIRFMRSNHEAQKRWFCYLPFNAPHFPNAKNKRPGQPNRWQAPDEAFAKYGFSPEDSNPERRYMAVVTALDTAIGRVMDAVDDMGSDQTFVFWFSDNGAFRLNRQGIDVGSNHPLREGGVTCWEGGIRVPAIARWTGNLPSGEVVSQPLWSPDLMVAAAKLAGAELPSVVLDGRDPLPCLRGDAPSPHESLYFQYRNHAAIRIGDWKIVRTSPERPWSLFDLSKDIGETNDLAERRPSMLQQLTTAFNDWNSGFDE